MSYRGFPKTKFVFDALVRDEDDVIFGFDPARVIVRHSFLIFFLKVSAFEQEESYIKGLRRHRQGCENHRDVCQECYPGGAIGGMDPGAHKVRVIVNGGLPRLSSIRRQTPLSQL